MLRKLTNYLISRIKGQHFELDPNISNSYLIGLVLSKVLMLIRGIVSFPLRSYRLYIGKGVSIKSKNKFLYGRGCVINNGGLIDALSFNGVKFGNNVSLGKRSVIECSGSLKNLGVGITIGDNVGLGRDCFYGCAGGIEIGEDTIIGNFVSFHSENHNAEDLNTPIRLQGVNHKGIHIGKNCWIGAKATILDGANIGHGCIIAAGAVVSAGTYLPNSIYGGIPAKLIKSRI